MQIISLRKGFTSDHSSTSYEFLAVAEPLDRQAIEEVSSLSSRAQPTDRTVSFIYHGDFNDLPGGWTPLMKEHFDIMYSESYDWWTFAVAFPVKTKEQRAELAEYEFSGLEDLGVMIDFHKERAVVSFYCTLDYGAAMPVLDNQGRDYRYYEEVDSFELKDYLNNDRLFKLLSEVRQQLITGDYRAFKVFWDVYGRPLYDEEAIQELKLPYDNNFDITTLPDNLKQFWNMLAVV